MLTYANSQSFFDDIKNSFFDVIVINTDIESDIIKFHENLQKTMPNIGAVYILPNEIDDKIVKQKGCFYLHKPFEIENVINLMNQMRDKNE